MLNVQDTRVKTKHRIIIGDSRDMREIQNGQVHLAVTSPPYFNAPFDYRGKFPSYDQSNDSFLALINNVAKELYRVVASGRIVCINCDDMLVDGIKYPIVADITKLFIEAGFCYRDRITWRKPDGYIRISRRSGVLLQHPYPMYFYPDNVQESILIFQKGKFDYKSIPIPIKDKSILDTEEYLKDKWYMSVWEFTNVLPLIRIEKNVAAFPDQLPYRLIKLFSFVGDTVLDPFLGSGTTTKISRLLGRNSIGYEIDRSLIPIIKEKIAINQIGFEDAEFEVFER